MTLLRQILLPRSLVRSSRVSSGGTVRTPGGGTPTTFYVNAQTGNDANLGDDPTRAWKTIAKANAKVYPGAIVQLTGDFSGQAIYPAVSGTAAAPIEYLGGGGGATLDLPSPTLGYMCLLSGRQYIIIDGIEFTNSLYATAPVTNKGVVLRGASYCQVRNCTFNNVCMQLINSHHCIIGDPTKDASRFHVGGPTVSNTWDTFVAQYQNGDPTKPMSAGDMLSILLGSHDNEIVGNDMRYGGHSLISVGNGFGTTVLANNYIHGNKLDNPWYKNLILSENGSGTIVQQNELLNATSVPTLISTQPPQNRPTSWPNDGLVYAAPALQLDGIGYDFSNNFIDGAVAIHGVISMGGRWYRDSLHPNGVLVESKNNKVYENVIQNCQAPAALVMEQNYDSTKDTSVPQISGNQIYDNSIDDGTMVGHVYSWDGTTHYETVLVRAFKGMPVWTAITPGGAPAPNTFKNNGVVNATNAFRSSYVNQQGVTTTLVKTLVQFEALDPTNISGNA